MTNYKHSSALAYPSARYVLEPEGQDPAEELTVRKKNGRIEAYNEQKIADAAAKALRAVGYEEGFVTAKALTCAERVTAQMRGRSVLDYNEIHDCVELTLMDISKEAAQAYIRYRWERKQQRAGRDLLIEGMQSIVKEADNENANMMNSPSTKIHQIASLNMRHYMLNYVLPPDIAEAHTAGDIHIHDLDYYNLCPNCAREEDFVSIMDYSGITKTIRFRELDSLLNLPSDTDPINLPVQGLLIHSKSGWVPLKRIMRRKLRQGELINLIKTRTGLTLGLTDQHRVPILRDGVPMLSNAADIISKDTLISNTEFDTETLNELNLLEMFAVASPETKAKIVLRNTRRLLDWICYKYSIRRYEDILGTEVKNFFVGADNDYAIPLNDMLSVLDRYPVPHEVLQLLSITKKKCHSALPVLFPITKAFARFIGYLLSEGCIPKQENSRKAVVTLANRNAQILEDMELCMRAAFNITITNHKIAGTMRVDGKELNSSIVLTFLTDVLGIKPGARNKNVPDIVFNFDETNKWEFVRGLLEGDGYYSTTRITYTTTSVDLADQLVLLYHSLGIRASKHETACLGTKAVFGDTVSVRTANSYAVNINNDEDIAKVFGSIESLRTTFDDQFIPSIYRYTGNEVRYVTREAYTGFVYDLETDDHYFYCNDILVHNCVTYDVGKLLENGFNMPHGFVRKPKRIMSATALVAVSLQSVQNDQYGGVAIDRIDTALAPYAANATDDEIYQAIEALIFNLNSLHSRAGNQVPFSSISIGVDTDLDARRVARAILDVYDKGLGKGEMPMFPNIIFKIKEGINWEPGTPNHDLLLRSIEVSSRRMNPTYLFLDSSFNAPYGLEASAMGCRTRVVANRCGPETSFGRGNIAFVTINLPRLGLKANHSTALLESLLNQKLNLCERQLIHRWDILKKLRVKDCPFEFSGIYLGSENLGPDDCIEPALRNGTLSIGFIGLAECVAAVTGFYPHENEEARQLGIMIIERMRQATDRMSEKHDLNFSTFATPAEGLSGRFTKIDKQLFGIVEKVTDKDHYTNSYHVPVAAPVTIAEKICIEAPYHRLCNAGHISYIEFDGPPRYNVEGIYDILSFMKDQDMGYVGLNFPIDQCSDCGYSDVFDGPCPACRGHHIKSVRRVTGYFSIKERINFGKTDEINHRTAHAGKEIQL